MLSPHAVAKRLFAYIFGLAKSGAKLRRRHIHEFKHVTIFVSGDRTGIAFDYRVCSGTVKLVVSLGYGESFMLRTGPLKPQEGGATSARPGNVENNALIGILFANLRVIFFHNYIRAQGLQTLLTSRHAIKNRTHHPSLSVDNCNACHGDHNQGQPRD